MDAKDTQGAGQRRLITGDEQALAAQLSDMFLELEVDVHAADERPRIAAQRRYFGDLELLRTRVRTGRVSVLRTGKLIARSRYNSFFVACVLAGTAGLAQASRQVALRARDLAVLDSTRPYRIDIDGRLDALWIRVPRHRVEGRLPAATEILAQRIDGSRGGGHLTTSLIKASLEQADTLSDSDALRVSNALLDLLVLSLDVSDGAPGSRARSLLRRVQNSIDANIGDPSLGRESLARSHGISVRYLGRLFEKEGLSVAQWIRLRRLELCRQRIEAPDYRASSISEIAYACGFSDISTFNRAFKRHFGATPGSLRQAARN